MRIRPVVAHVEKRALAEPMRNQFLSARGLITQSGEWPDFIVIHDGVAQISCHAPSKIPPRAERVVYTCGTVSLTVVASTGV